MQTALNLPPAEAMPAPITAPFEAGVWSCADQWLDGYRMLCWGRRHTRYDTDPTRRHAYDEAIRRHVRDLASPQGLRLIRRDTNRKGLAYVRGILDRAGLLRDLLPLAERLPLIALLHNQETRVA